MRKTIYTLFIYIMLFLVQAIAQPISPVEFPKRESRAVWLTTYSSLDWPKQKATSEAGVRAQQEELCEILDRLKAININTVLLQTRVRGSVIYPSTIEPWDGCLTGISGRSPGYDPLAFAIKECHKRGMELHAWVVTIPCFKTSAVPTDRKSVLNTHRNLCVRHNNSWYLDPGQPGTAVYLTSICKEIARNYNVDGIHLDYIRYPENASKFNDQATYRKYGKKQDKNEWRRDNVTHCVRMMYQAIKTIKPWIKVSSSPVGKHDDLNRYSSYGWNAHTAVYQDAQGWLREGIQDMLFPMMYFRGNHFFPFAADWKEQDNGKEVVPGLGIYFLSPLEKDWPLEDITRELYFTRNMELGGQAYFRYKYLYENHKGLYDFLKNEFYPYPSLTPQCNSLDNIAPATPGNLHLTGGQNGTLQWEASTDNVCKEDVRYNIYAAKGETADINRAQHLIASYVDSCSISINAVTCDLYNIHFAVTAIDRFGNESTPAHLSASNTPSVPASTSRFMVHDGIRLSLPAINCPFVAFVDAFGQIIRTAPYSPNVRIDHLKKGMYQVRILEKRGRSTGIGYFIK